MMVLNEDENRLCRPLATVADCIEATARAQALFEAIHHIGGGPHSAPNIDLMHRLSAVGFDLCRVALNWIMDKEEADSAGGEGVRNPEKPAELRKNVVPDKRL